jgi:hypothetical protein
MGEAALIEEPRGAFNSRCHEGNDRIFLSELREQVASRPRQPDSFRLHVNASGSIVPTLEATNDPPVRLGRTARGRTHRFARLRNERHPLPDDAEENGARCSAGVTRIVSAAAVFCQFERRRAGQKSTEVYPFVENKALFELRPGTVVTGCFG